MAHFQAQALRDNIGQFDARNLGTVAQFFEDDATVHVMSRGSLAGDYTGRNAIRRFFERIVAVSDQNETNVQDVAATDDYVAAIVETRGSARGHNIRNPEVYVFRTKGGRVSEAWYVSSEDYPVEEIFQ
jgi:ketosteroid isomerase-like protein